MDGAATTRRAALILDRDPGDEHQPVRCPVCGENYDQDLGCCIAGCGEHWAEEPDGEEEE